MNSLATNKKHLPTRVVVNPPTMNSTRASKSDNTLKAYKLALRHLGDGMAGQRSPDAPHHRRGIQVASELAQPAPSSWSNFQDHGGRGLPTVHMPWI